MAGCYGDHPEDRYYERMLDSYLDSQDIPEEGQDDESDAADPEPAYDPDPCEDDDDYF